VQIDLKPTGPLVKWIGPDGGWLTGFVFEPQPEHSSIWTMVQPEGGRVPAIVSTELLMPHSRDDKE